MTTHKRAGVGQFFAWDGGCMFIGHHDRQLAVHSHQALQLVVASEGDHLVRGGGDESWRSYTMAAIPSNHPHGLDVTSSDYGAVILVEPETREGRAITHRFLQRGIAECGGRDALAVSRSMFEKWRAGRGADTSAEARRLINVLSDGVEPPVVTDERILRATRYINSHLDQSLTLKEVASEANLSPGRFRHLFSEQVGMGLRPYILWRRFVLTWNELMKGKTLSEAAHSAGFADAAHLSRTSVRNFGFAPSGIEVGQSPPDPSTLPDRSTRRSSRP
jgi:AraC-like DNA-binding protein